MTYVKKLIRGEVTTMRHFHGWATVVWLAASLPICIFLNDWIPGIVFMSVYAIVTGHWAAWQATRAEQYADPDSSNP